MTRIRLYEGLTATAEQVFEAESIGSWLLSHFGDAPRVGVQVFAGEPSTETDVTGDIEALLRSDAPEYVVLQNPGGEYLAAIQIVLAFISTAIALTASEPQMPNNVNRTQQSPNNALGSRENQVRVLQRVEDIYGTVKAIPSLMMPTYRKYKNNRAYEYGYYCVSRGYCSLDEVSDGDTLIEVITGASAAIYHPFTSPNSGDAPVLQIGDSIIDKILTAARSNEVDGITLKPLNQLQLQRDELYQFTPNAAGDVITQIRKAPNVNSIISPGDVITVAMSTVTVGGALNAQASAGGFAYQATATSGGEGGDIYSDPLGDVRVGDTVTVTGTGSNDGAYPVTSITFGGSPAVGFLGTSPAPATADTGFVPMNITTTRNYSGSYTVAGVADGFIILSTALFKSGIQTTATIDVSSEDPVTEYTDWVSLNTPDRTEIWVNIVALNGLVKDDGGQSTCTVEFEITIEKLDPITFAPTGAVEIVTSSLTGSVTDEVDDTVEHATAWTGPARVRMRRTSQHDFDFAGRVTDEIKWADLYSVTPVAQDHFGNKTTIRTVTQATTRSTAVKTRQLNAITSRLLPTFNGTSFSGALDADGRIVSGAISATSRLVDIIAAVSVDPKIGRRDLATDIDMAQIWGAQQQLDAWSPHAGQFNFTFDSDNTSFEETLMQIANAGFCVAYRQNGKIRLALDRQQSASTALFTHRNKKLNSETITRKFSADGEFDGVEFVYTDPDSNVSETIRLPLDPDTAALVGWPESGSYSMLKKFEIPGIRSFEQAWFRANREYRKLLGQRVSIETSTTLDARALLPNARIDIVDNTRFKAYDGEVVGQSGLVLTTSQKVEFEAGQPHSIVLMRRDGSTQSIPVTAGANARQVVLAYAPTEAIVTEGGAEGVRTIYSVASDSARQAMAYLVAEIDLQDPQYPTVRAVNYSDSYYEADTIAVPPKAPIIN